MAIIMAGRKWTAQYEFYAHQAGDRRWPEAGDLRCDRRGTAAGHAGR
jgi:hypothetical protein